MDPNMRGPIEVRRTEVLVTKAVETLMQEHRVIEQVLGSLETFAARVREGGPADRAAIALYAEFFREFADRCHHGKEEDRLFERMTARGLPREAGPVAVMLAEHEEGRAHVRALAVLGEGLGPLSGAEREVLLAHADAYVALLRQHIVKEDNVLFPMAAQLLPAGEMEGLAEAFEEFETKVMGEGAHARLHALAEGLVAACPPDPARMAAASGCSGCGGHC
jgi:hemerythrin-like domain-containing protein